MERLINLPTDAARITQHMAALKPGKYAFALVHANAKKQRTLAQNAYWWSALYPAIAEGIREQWGETYSPEEVHEFCKQQFLSRPVVDRSTGDMKGFIVGSTRGLSIESGVEYTNKLLKLAAQLGVYVDSPDEICGGSGAAKVRSVAAATPMEVSHAA